MPESPWRTLGATDPNGEYVALLSYLPLKSYRRIPHFLFYTVQVVKQLASAEEVLMCRVAAIFSSRRMMGEDSSSGTNGPFSTPPYSCKIVAWPGEFSSQKGEPKMAVPNSHPLCKELVFQEGKPPTSDWVILPEATEEEIRSGEYFLLDSLGAFAHGGRCQLPTRGL
jgi:hypothetical protein